MDLWNDLALDAAVADAIEADLLDGPTTPQEPEIHDDATELDSRCLARAVIHQALRDLLSPSRQLALAAYFFLTQPSTDLETWSTLADLPLDPHRLRRIPLAEIRLRTQQTLDELVLEAA